MFCYSIIIESEQMFGKVYNMKTNSRYKKLIRQRKLRRQRRIALIALMIFVIMIGNVAFSNDSQKGTDVAVVVVEQGDTIWSIAEEYKPANVNLNEYVHAIAANNGVKDGNIFVGQSLYIPC